MTTMLAYTPSGFAVIAQTGFASTWWKIDAQRDRDGSTLEVGLETRPTYCDRGNYICKLRGNGRINLELDAADGWPRYYFDWDRMLAEVDAWLIRRGFHTAIIPEAPQERP